MNESNNQKEVLLARIRDVMELIKADPALQDDDIRKEDREAVEELIKEINSDYESINGREDNDLREARNELDDLLKEREESLSIFENVGFEETISDEELDTLMERLGEAMTMSDNLAGQITTLTEARLDAAYGRYQEQTQELQNLNDKKIELDNMSKPTVIRLTKNIDELHKKSEAEFVKKLTEIGNRQSKLISSQESKRKEDFDNQKQKMVDRFAREMEENEKMAYISEGAKKDQYLQKYETARKKFEQAQGMEFKSFPEAYDSLEQEKRELIDKQNETRAKYAGYVDNLEQYSMKLGIYDEFMKYKPVINATAGAKREEPIEKGDNPVPPVDPHEYHLKGNEIPQDPKIRPDGPEGPGGPTGNGGNNGGNGGNNGSNPPGKNNDAPTPLLPGKALGKDRPTGPDGPNGPTDPRDPNYDPDEPETPEKPKEDPETPDEPEDVPTGEIRIIAKKVWTWMKDHPAKTALIIAGIVGLTILLANIGPIMSLMAQKGAINGMLFHGQQWAAADAGMKTFLHGQNMKLAADVFGNAAAFNEATGIWTIGGQSLAAAKAAIGAKLVGANALGALSVGSLGLGLGSLLKGKEFKQIYEEIIVIKKGNLKSLEDVDKQLEYIKEKVHNNDKLSRKEKETLIKRANEVKKEYEEKLKKDPKAVTPKQNIDPNAPKQPTNEIPALPPHEEEPVEEPIEDFDVENMSDEDYETFKDQVAQSLIETGIPQDQAIILAEQTLEKMGKKKGM